MANPYPIELREREVRAYEPGGASYATVADRFSVNLWTLLRWVQRRRATGTVAALGKRGGWSLSMATENCTLLGRTSRAERTFSR